MDTSSDEESDPEVQKYINEAREAVKREREREEANEPLKKLSDVARQLPHSYFRDMAEVLLHNSYLEWLKNERSIKRAPHGALNDPVFMEQAFKQNKMAINDYPHLYNNEAFLRMAKEVYERNPERFKSDVEKGNIKVMRLVESGIFTEMLNTLFVQHPELLRKQIESGALDLTNPALNADRDFLEIVYEAYKDIDNLYWPDALQRHRGLNMMRVVEHPVSIMTAGWFDDSHLNKYEDDPNFVVEAITNNPEVYRHVSDHRKLNNNMLLAALANGGNANLIAEAPNINTLRNDDFFRDRALQANPDVLNYL